MLQCSCLNSLGTKRCFQIVFFISQLEHYIFLEDVDWYHILLHKEGTHDPLFVFGKVRCRFNVLCLVRRPNKIFKSFCDSLTAYFANWVLLSCSSCLACRQLWMLFHLLVCSWADHWLSVFLTLVIENPSAASGPVKSIIAACFFKPYAISLPS